jgi:hypothetical protein
MPPAQPSTENGAQQTAAAADNGLNKTSHDTARKSDSINR